MSEELGVDPQVLIHAAQGITAVIDSLAELGIGETAAAGRGFSLLALSPLEAGKQDVQTSLEEFAERWSWGVRNLVQAGNSIAETLDLAAGRYHIMEQENSDAVKTVWTHLAGNPHLSSEEIADRTWGETLADNPVNHVVNADYSPESFAESAEAIETNNEAIAEVAPQAFANISPELAAASAVEAERGYNTGAAEQAANITAAQGERFP
ncbi:hypothetical protein [Rhodococcus sp. NPDC058521]|uniref:hypothetical protein n=1 Tax=Rhodococcus sp. NPDC058521 TaxID=3346536 RepID=UPI00366A355A